MFSGSIPALITPFENGALDEKSFQAFCDWQIAEGSSGLVPCGTTGESPTLSHDEHKRVVELCVEATNGRVPVIAGAGSNNTAEAIDLSQHAQKAGADAVLIVTPYYNKPTQAGLYAHYKAIHDSIDLPIIIYNIPGRSVVNMSIETMNNLAQLPNIVGVKDSTSNLERVSATRMLLGSNFCQMSGEDSIALALRAHGAHGCISVTANIAPRLCADMHAACDAGDFATALEIQDRLLPLHIALFAETSPGPVKHGASLLGKASPEMRLPMVEIETATKDRVEVAMKSAGLLN
jgi:4-hydroxy-tetrahydrodipicolinate synthase